jgi:hypothetical protein
VWDKETERIVIFLCFLEVGPWLIGETKLGMKQGETGLGWGGGGY